MSFNVDKCMVMHIGRRNIRSRYFMNRLELSAIVEENDVGVFITDGLTVSKQCSQEYLKLSRVLGMILRTITFRNKYILHTIYKTLVRLHLEYCTPAWSSHYVKDKILLERVQHRFTRMVSGLMNLPYADNEHWDFGAWRREGTELTS